MNTSCPPRRSCVRRRRRPPAAVDNSASVVARFPNSSLGDCDCDRLAQPAAMNRKPVTTWVEYAVRPGNASVYHRRCPALQRLPPRSGLTRTLGVGFQVIRLWNQASDTTRALEAQQASHRCMLAGAATLFVVHGIAGTASCSPPSQQPRSTALPPPFLSLRQARVLLVQLSPSAVPT